VVWVPFNESWGQHRTMEVGAFVARRDPSRLLNIASGGNFWPVGDIADAHKYPHPGFPFELNEGGRFDDYIKVVGEFGGHGYPVQGHLWDAGRRNWGYGGLPKSAAEYRERYEKSISILTDLKTGGVSGGVYTQTTDVEEEINGLMTYDRKVMKIPAEDLKKIHAPLLLLACFLPVFHQSALVGLYVITKGRLDPLWWSQLLPVYAVMTFFYIGPAVVMLENVIANRVYGRPVHMKIISDMFPVAALVMFMYLVLRLADYAVRGVFDELLSGSLYANLALIELGIGVALPMVMFANRELRTSKRSMVVASLLAVGGIWLFRFNVTMAGLVESIGVGWYRPHWMETVVVLGLASGVALAYLFIVENFPIYTLEDVAASEAAVAEARARAKAADVQPKTSVLPVEHVKELERTGSSR